MDVDSSSASDGEPSEVLVDKAKALEFLKKSKVGLGRGFEHVLGVYFSPKNWTSGFTGVFRATTFGDQRSSPSQSP